MQALLAELSTFLHVELDPHPLNVEQINYRERVILPPAVDARRIELAERLVRIHSLMRLADEILANIRAPDGTAG